MADLGALALAAVTEIDRLGRLSDKTREQITDALDDHASGRVVAAPDPDDGTDDDGSSSTAGTGSGHDTKSAKSAAPKSGAKSKGA